MNNSEEVIVPRDPDKILEQKRLIDELRGFFLSHETEKSRRMFSVTQDIAEEWSQSGKESVFLVGGSVGFGQANDETEDIDLTYVGNNPAEFRRQVGRLPERYVAQGDGVDHIDYTDIDPRLVRRYLETQEQHKPFEDFVEKHDFGDVVFNEEFAIDQVRRFILTYWMSRPTNRSLDALFNRAMQLESKPTSEARATADLNTSVAGSWKGDFANSFNKYNRRLVERGVEIPQAILAIQHTLIV